MSIDCPYAKLDVRCDNFNAKIHCKCLFEGTFLRKVPMKKQKSHKDIRTAKCNLSERVSVSFALGC